MIKIAVACGVREEILHVVRAAKAENNEIEFHVFDDKENCAEDGVWIYHPCENEADAVTQAVTWADNGQADILMKGNVKTHTLLKEVLKKDYHLKTQAVLSHVTFVKIPKRNQPFLLTDAGMNLQPTEDQLFEIARNAIHIAHLLGLDKPKVALISSAENINPKMISSVLAVNLKERLQEEDAIVEGPLSFDLALSPKSVERKGYQGKVMGDADIIVVPTIDVGNVIYKSLLLFGDAELGGVIAGTKVPIVITSRSDSSSSKLQALTFAIQQVIGGRSDDNVK